MLLGKQAGEGADSLGEPIILPVLDEGGHTLAFEQSVSCEMRHIYG